MLETLSLEPSSSCISKDELLEAGKTVDPMRFDVIGRLSGTRYCRTGSVFEISAEGEKER
jgi:hypothetical protein